MAEEPKGGVGAVVAGALRSYFSDFGKLKHCKREFWVVQLVNLLDGVAYFAMMTVSSLYLSETLGYSDSQAAWIWGSVMMVYTGVGFGAGFVGDSLGIKRTLYLSIFLLIISRLSISFSESKAVVLPALFVIMVGTAIMTPILIAATKRYTTKDSQTAGFNLLYFLMNIGAFLGNFMLDPLRALPWGNRSIFMLGSLMGILCWLSIVVFWHKGIEDVDAQKRGGDDVWENPITIAISVMRESAFWRFMLFLVVLVGVRLVFEHQYQVYPKYYQRTMAAFLFETDGEWQDDLDHQEIPDGLRAVFADNGIDLGAHPTVKVGESGKRWRVENAPEGDERVYFLRRDGDHLVINRTEAPIGLLNSINPLIICIGVIVSTPIVARFKLFNVMFFGITLSAGSMVFLTIPPGWVADVFGVTINNAYYVIVIAQICVFSLGELIWSPRLYEYTAAIAPEGREASYMGLSYFPMFFARFAEGPIAGYLLTKYCPPDVGSRLATVPYTQSPQFMNVILACIAISTPILILVFRGVIQKESRLEKAEATDNENGGA